MAMKTNRFKLIVPYAATVIALILAGLIFMTVHGERLPGLLATFLGGVLITASSIACVSDLKYRKIWNSTTFSTLFIVFGVHVILHSCHASETVRRAWGAISVNQALLGTIVCLLLTGLPFLITHKGAGDVKLAMLCGAILGALSGIAAVVLAYLFAACLLVSFHFYKHGVFTTVRSVLKLIFSWILPLWVPQPNAEENALLKSSLPLAPGFCLATIVMLYRY